MSDIGLIERSTLSGLIEEVKRLSGTTDPLTPKQAVTIATNIEDIDMDRETINGIIDEHLDENLNGRLDTYMDENLDDRMDKHLDENLEERLDKYIEENPLAPKITINGEGPDENGNFNIELGSVDSNNVVEF